jgi:hypothetical protein
MVVPLGFSRTLLHQPSQSFDAGEPRGQATPDQSESLNIPVLNRMIPLQEKTWQGRRKCRQPPNPRPILPKN